MSLKAILLDVDGTLVDSNDVHARAWVRALAEFDHPVAFETVRPLIGMGGDKLLPRAAGIEKDSKEGKRIGERRGEIFTEEYLPSLRPFARTRDLLRRMSADGLTLVVASSAESGELSALLKIAGVDDLIEDQTSSDEADRPKPDPDIVSAALARAGASSDEALMVGDTPYDVEAARRAGIAIIALRSGGWDDRALAGAVAIYDDPAALLAAYEESPIGRALGNVVGRTL